MRFSPAAVTLATLALSATLTVQAHAQLIDQQNSNVGATTLWHWTSAWQGQTFTPTANSVVGAGVFLRGGFDNVSTTATLDMQLWTGRPDLGGVFLAGGTTPFTVTGTNSGGGWFDVFWSAVTVTPGNVYALVFHTSDPTNRVLTTTDDTNFAGYTGGEMFGSFSSSVGGPYFYGGGDINFREYSAVVATPEPASIVLLATGLIALAVTRRRR